MDKLKWETVEYSIADFAPAGKVITQRDVLEKYKAKHSDADVKTFSGFKYNPQERTVSLRIGITNDSIAADSGTVAKIEPELLQSERDELIAFQEKYDELQQELNKTGLALLDAIKEVEGLKTKYDALKVENDKLQRESGTVIKLYDNVRKELDEWKNQLRCNSDVSLGLEKEHLELKAKYDALVEAVGKDAQKFSAMLVENDKLRDEIAGWIGKINKVREEFGQLKDENETLHDNYDNVVAGAHKDDKEFSQLKWENDRLILRLAETDEDSADLVEAKKAIAEGGGISLDEVEDAVENQKPVTDGVDMPEGELDDGTPDCRSDGTVPEDDENVR